MWTSSSYTKENQKGHSRSYNYRRRIVIVLCILISVSFVIWQLFSKLSTSSISSSTSDNVGVISNQPIRNIEYGVQSTTPLVMIHSKLDDQLHKRFLEEFLYSCTEDELNNIHELDNRVKEPVYVYEGYYHSMPTNEKIYSRNPNPMIGKDFDKPPASQFTRAFYDAFRYINRDIFDTLKHNLLAQSSYNNTKQEDVCYILANWIEMDKHFGDLSIQMHYGKGNEQKLISGAAWHTDAENSLLHLAVTLRGSRVLHSKRIRSNTTQLRQPLKNQVPQEILEQQNPGDVYLSSSTLMRHAPQFFDTNYNTRVIAIHARILYTSEEVDHFRKVRTKDGWNKLTNTLANTLARADIQMPTLAQVENR